MPNNYGPRIVTDGLVLCLDAGNTKSYTGSGTTWTDISRNGINGSLKNGPTFSNSNTGSIVLDGTNDYIECPDYSGLDFVDKSFQCWIKKSGNSIRGIVDKDFDRGGGNYGGWGFWIQANGKLWWWNHANQDILDNGSLVVSPNIWTNVAVAYNSTSKNASFYINGVLNSSITNGNIVEKSSTTALFVIGALRNSNNYFDGNISSVFAYNRVLSGSQILQNYNATKGRFKL